MSRVKIQEETASWDEIEFKGANFQVPLCANELMELLDRLNELGASTLPLVVIECDAKGKPLRFPPRFLTVHGLTAIGPNHPKVVMILATESKETL